MKTNKKLYTRHLFLVFLILFIGLVSLGSINAYFENSRIGGEIDEITHELQFLITKFFILGHTEDMDDYEKIKSDIEMRRSGFDLALKKHRPDMATFDIDETLKFESNIDDYTRVSNGLMRLQGNVLSEYHEFLEKAQAEKQLRYALRNSAIKANDAELRNFVWHTEYHSKEATYQYRDEKHFDEWFETIEDIKNYTESTELQEEAKNELLHHLHDYESVAPDIEYIVLELNEMSREKRLKLEELRTIVGRLERSGKEITNSINSQNEALAGNTFWIIIIGVAGGVILLLLEHLYFMPSISKISRTKRSLRRRRA